MSNSGIIRSHSHYQYRPFCEVAYFTRGVIYPKSMELPHGSEGIKILRANNITLSGNTLNFDDVRIISAAAAIKDSQFLKKNDILICIGSGSREHIGKAAFIDENMDFAFGGFMGALRVKKDLIPKYLFHVITSTIFKRHLNRHANSITINNITNEVWKSFCLPVPPIKEQEDIAAKIDSMINASDSLIDKLKSEIAARTLQKDLLRDIIICGKQ